MHGPEGLATYQAERDDLLARITRQARADPRMVAAWLFGSLGRGTADALSDLDVWLVVADAHAPECVAQRRAAAAQPGPLCWLVEAPQNAPRHGGYVMAGYTAATAPHLVDWYWQPQSLARRPAETRLLFDRVGLPGADTPTPLAADDALPGTIAEPLNSISFFWAMLTICAKALYRHSDDVEGLRPHALAALHRVQDRLGLAPTSVRAAGDWQSPGAHLPTLRALGRAMQTATRQAASRGWVVPARAARAGQRYLDFVEALLGV